MRPAREGNYHRIVVRAPREGLGLGQVSLRADAFVSAWSSAKKQKTPYFSERQQRLTKKTSKAFSQELEVGVTRKA